MIVFLRFVGVMNAAVWFGGMIFFTFGVAPAIFTPTMKAWFGDEWVGMIAQVVLERFFILNYSCGALALAHLLAEWVYLGKPIHRLTLGILLGAFCISLMGGLWLQPKLKRLHQIRYAAEGVGVTVAQRAQAARSFSLWHGLSQVLNLFVLAGVGVYVWRVTHSPEAPRFVSSPKFRS